MTKKDYKLFAEMFVRLESEAERLESEAERFEIKEFNEAKYVRLSEIELEFTNLLSRENSRFSWDKWNAFKDKMRKDLKRSLAE